MKLLKRRALSLLCAALLVGSLVPAAALAAPAGAERAAEPAIEVAVGADRGAAGAASGAGGSPDADVAAERPARELRSTFSADVRTSAELRSALFALTPEGEVALTPGSHEAFIDRVAISRYARDFYDRLVEASDADGEADYLIEDRWFDRAALSPLDSAVSPVGLVEGHAVLYAGAIPDAALLSEEEREAAEREGYLYLYAALAAFDRDHPEVFWMNSHVIMGSSFSGDDLELLLVLSGEDFDARTPFWRSEGAVRAAIAQRDADAEAILGELRAAGAAAEPFEAVRFLNRWLVERNQYNADPSGDLAQLHASYPAAFECVSALAGRLGAEGPVCEGYARALKVLCDRLGIPCVLVDGWALADAEADLRAPHMWNYVELDGAWYGIDVTWNDLEASDDPNPPYDPYWNEWLLVKGAKSVDWDDREFLDTHPVENRLFAEIGPSYTNGPVLAEEAYAPKAEPAVSVPVGLAATYGERLASVALPAPAAGETPGAWSWAVPDQLVGNAGTRTFRAVFTPEDRATFAAVAREVAVEVAPKSVTPQVELDALRYTWAGHPVTPSVTVRDGDAVIPAGEYVVGYEDNDALGTATVRVTDAPGGNYALGEATATFELVERPTPKLAVAGLVKTYDGVAVDARALLADATATVEGHEVPGTWSVADAPEMVDAGAYEVTVRFEPDDVGACLPATVKAHVAIERRPATLGVALATNRLTAQDAVEAPRLVVSGLVEGESLEPAVVPAFSGLPATGQVGAHTVTWENADAVLAAVRELPAASNYEVSLTGGRSLELTVADVTLAAVDDARLRVELAALDAAPEGLAATPFQTPEAVEAELMRAVRAALPTAGPERFAVYETALFATDDGGRTWVAVDAENFPAEGLTLTVPLPEGADPEAHRFAAAHMFTAAMGGHGPGDVEACAAAAGADGASFTVTGLSPVAVGWGDEPTEEALRAVAMAQTGDRLAPFALALVCALSALLVAAMSRRRIRG